MRNSLNLTAIFLVLLGILVGCSSGGNPVTPMSGPDLRSASSPSSRILWGMYNLVIDASTGDMDIIPDRASSFTCNVVNFLQPPIAPINLITKNLVTNESNIPAGYFVFDISLHHPFPGTKFCGFDVMGIIMSRFVAHAFQSDPTLAGELPPSNLLQNPDGYTRWWNPVEFTTYDKLFGYINGKLALGNFNCNHTLNPFKYFSDDTGVDDFFDPDPDLRGFFSSSEPGINTRRYRLQFDMSTGTPKFEVKYAISANYAGPPDPDVPPYTPDSYPPSANMSEAYRIEYIDTGSTAFYVNDTTYGGDLDFLVEVRDWQFDGSLSSVIQEIEGITVESPTLFDTPVDLDITQFETVPSNHTVVRIPGHIDNISPSSTHNQLILITVRSGEPSTYEPQIPGITGFVYPDAPLAGYNIIAIPISDTPSEEIPVIIGQGNFAGNDCLQINSHGYPEIFYTRSPNSTLGYAKFDGASWDDYSVDYALFTSEGLELDQYDNPHIVYGAADQEGTYYATNDGSGWEHTVVYSLCWPGSDSSLELDSMDLPHLAIHGGGGGGQGVWHYWFDGDFWNSEHPTPPQQLIGPQIKIDSDDYVHIFTHEMYGTGMYHVYQTDIDWVVENIGLGGNMQDAEFDSLGNIHMAYSIGAGGWSTNQLGYAVRTETGWSDETKVDEVGDLRQSSLVLDSNDLPHIAYVERLTSVLKYAHFNGTSWQCSVLVDDCEVNGRTSIQMLPGDIPIIAYCDWGNDLVKCIVLD